MDKRFTLIHRRLVESLKIKSPIEVSDWADRYRYLSEASSSEPGRWSTSRTPYLKEIMNNLSPSQIKRVVIMKGHQIGYTEGCLMNGIGYIICENPGPTMLVAPSEKAVKKILHQKIEPMIFDSPEVSKRISKISRFNERNTMIHKDFNGGFLVLAGATIPSDLASTSVRNLFLDEVDRMTLDTGGEGSPVELAIGRTSSYNRKKIIMGSTPVDEERSVIKRYFEDGDQRYYFVPCPKCGHLQTLIIERLDYSDMDDIFYRCERCDHKIREHNKTLMLERGTWKPTQQSDPSIRSYHLNSLYSPVGFLSWKEVASAAVRAQGDEIFSQTFKNLFLGLPSSLTIEETPIPEIILGRKKLYKSKDTPGRITTFNTAAVDIQGDRIECLITLWEKRRCWIHDHLVFYGDTNSNIDSPPWSELSEVLSSSFKGKQLHSLGIDTGYIPHKVFTWIKAQRDRRIKGIRGVATLEGIVSTTKHMEVSISSGKKSKVGNKYHDLNTHLLKQEIYKRLLIEDSNSEDYIHFPNDLEREFYEQLCSERMILNRTDIMDRTGLPRYKWIAVRARNEALDLMVYNLGLWYGANAPVWIDKWDRFIKIKSSSL